MTREEQVAQAEANLTLLRGNVIGVLSMADLTCGGSVAATVVSPEIEDGNYTGAAIITRNGVRYRITVDFA